MSTPAAPRDYRTLTTLCRKHPTEDPAATATDKAQAEQHVGTTAVGEQELQPEVTAEPLNTQGQIPKVDNLFKGATM